MSDFNLRDAWSDAISRLRTNQCAEGLIALHESGHISRLEVMNDVWDYCVRDPDGMKIVVRRMKDHPEQWVREIAADTLSTIARLENRVTVIDEVMKSTPLRPGTRIRLDGGYDNPWWLNGNEYYAATFIRFASRGTGEMPVAFVELDDEIRMIEGSGLEHLGKYALLKLLYVADWDGTGTVTVHIVGKWPDDAAAFYDSHPFGTEFESHATYRVDTTIST